MFVATATHAADSVFSVCTSLTEVDKRIAACTAFLASGTVETAHDRARAYSSRAGGYEAKRNRDLAIADYTASLGLQPGNVYVLRRRGLLYSARGDYDLAIADFTEALRLVPNFTSVYQDRGNAYRDKGQYDKAIADYTETVRLESWRDEAKRNLEQAKIKLASKTQSGAGTSVSASPSQLMPTSSDRRVALVIGNASYKNAPVLPNPERDAKAIAEALRKTGFQTVAVQSDLGREALIDALRDFAQLAEKADWAMVYYAGHGIEVGGVNYLIPTDAKLSSDRDASLEAVALDQVINAAERAGKLRLIVLDACRDNPFANQMKRSLTVGSRSVSRGLAQVEPDAGTLVVYAAKHGETALDGDGSNSPFAAAFVKNMQMPGVEVRRLFDNVRDDVMDATKRRQQPFSYGSISGKQDFYFVAAK
jgi:hypothetical protein